MHLKYTTSLPHIKERRGNSVWKRNKEGEINYFTAAMEQVNRKCRNNASKFIECFKGGILY
jgi:hypothetical protein